MKIADSFFVNNGDTTRVQLKYPTTGTIIMQTPKNEYRLNKNGKVERNDGVGWVIPVTEDPDYHKNLIIQADQNKTSQPVNIFKYYWNKIFKNEQGGTMNYAQYLQPGGNLAQPEIEERLGEQQVNELVQAVINGDEAAAQTLVENAIKDPENAYISETLASAIEAAQNGDETAQKFMAVIGPMLEQIQQAQSLKCGGRVRAKVKKASCGKKLEKGAKVPVEKKGGCPCQYKKIGGHIKLVDCNGIPVAKNGSILYAKPGDQLPPAKASEGVISYMTAKPISKAAPFSDQWFGDLGHAFVRKMDAWQADLQRKNPSFWGNPTQQVTPVAEPAVGSEEWKAQQRAAQEAYNQSPEGQAAIARANEAVAARQTVAPAAAPKQTWRQMFDAGKVKYGGLTKDEALARQREMQAAKGFNVNLGKWGADGMWGNQSKAEWERYQQWKAAQSAQPQMSAGEKFVSEGYASGRPWQDAELQNMDADQAIHLKTPDYNRWMSLNFNQTKAKPYIAPASPVLNPNAVRKDYPTGIAPYTGVNPIVAARKDGGKMPYADYLK